MTDAPVDETPADDARIASVTPEAEVTVPDAPVAEATIAETPATETPATEMQARNASDAYVFAAVLCAVVGIVIPVVPAAAALMLVRATDDDLADQPLRPQLASMRSFARGLAWFDLAWMTLLTLAFLLSTLGRVIS